MKYIQIDSDRWEDNNRTFRVLEYVRPDSRSTSTRVDLVLEQEDGSIIRRTVPDHTIRWIFNY